MIPLLVAPYVTDLSSPAARAILLLDWLIWAVFAVDLGYRVYLTPSRARYLRRHWFDVLIVAVPFLRPLRAVRVLRAFRLAGLLGRVAYITRALRSHGGDVVLLVAAGVVMGAAAAVTMIEGGSDATLADFGNWLWWAIATATTVGYGDVVPDTVAARVLGAGLMLVGVAVFGILTANVAAWFVSQDDEPDDQRLLQAVAALDERLDRIERAVTQGDRRERP